MSTRYTRAGLALIGLAVGVILKTACASPCDDLSETQFHIDGYVERDEPPVLQNAELQLRPHDMDITYETPEGHTYRVTYDRVE